MAQDEYLGMYILAEKKGREGRKTGNFCFVRTNSAPDLSFLFPVFNQYIVFFRIFTAKTN
ncbi:hypothetical protein [Alistipes sp. AF48-12]|uniref:hypothetical protein n=1 Tax=Alistipes sp. AF48-12 TaxID=2291998 RepID=UPI0011C3FC75|nr:hypothetical protein [Alistipes sp. AF48-12]